MLRKLLIAHCHPLGISPPRARSHLQPWGVHAVLLPGKKKKKILHKMKPAPSYRKVGAFPPTEETLAAETLPGVFSVILVQRCIAAL